MTAAAIRQHCFIGIPIQVAKHDLERARRAALVRCIRDQGWSLLWVIIQEPFECFTEFLPKIGFCIESQILLYLHWIDGIAPVVPGPVLDELDLRFVRCATGAQFIHDGTQGFHHLQVGTLTVTADVVGLATFTLLYDEFDAAAVIFHMQPVANVFAIAIDWQGFALQQIDNTQGDELLRELIGSVELISK